MNEVNPSRGSDSQEPSNYEGSLATSSGLNSSNDATIINDNQIPEDGECPSISGVLRYCKRRILYPYLKLLGIIGLKPLNTDSSDLCKFSLVMTKMYVAIVIILLLTGYALQYLTCFRRDWGFNYKEEFSETAPYPDLFDTNARSNNNIISPHDSNLNDSSLTIENDRLEDQRTFTTTAPEVGGQNPYLHDICSGNVFYVHFLPSLLHFMSFIYMLSVLYSDEQLQNLMERVFIQAIHACYSFFSQKKVLRTLKLLAAFGVLWIILSISIIVLQIVNHKIIVAFWPSIGFPEKITLAAVMGFSTLWQDLIQVTVIISYCTHCHLLSIYLDFIHSRISQHSITLSECIKEIGEIDKLLRYVNNELASGLLPLLMLDVMIFIGSITFLLGHGSKLIMQDLIIAVTGCVLWLCLIAIPLFQAAKLSTALKKVRELGHLVRMRPFGYQNYEQSDLDSFLLFVSTLKMDVRILKMPLSATNLSIFVSVLTFTIFLWGYLR